MKKISALLLGVSVCLAACGGETEDVQSLDEGAASIDEENKTLTIALGTDVVSFDIHDHNNTSTELCTTTCLTIYLNGIAKTRYNQNL